MYVINWLKVEQTNSVEGMKGHGEGALEDSRMTLKGDEERHAGH